MVKSVSRSTFLIVLDFNAIGKKNLFTNVKNYQDLLTLKFLYGSFLNKFIDLKICLF